MNAHNEYIKNYGFVFCHTIEMKKVILIHLLLALVWMSGEAQVVVKPGAWPTMCQDGSYVTQTKKIVIKETLPGDFAHINCSGGYFILAPNGYSFQYNVGTVSLYSGGDFSIPTFAYEIYMSWIRIDYELNGVSTIDSIVIDGTSLNAVAGASTSVNLTKYDPGGGCNIVQNGNMAVDAKNHGTLLSVANPPPKITYASEPYYCSDQNVNYTLTATPSGAGGTWSGTGVSGSTFNGFGLSAGVNVVTYTYVYAPGCVNSNAIGLTIKVPPTISLGSSDVDNIICPNQSVTFTATATGSNKRYQFLKNGVPVTTLSATNTYTTTTLLNNDQISVAADNGNLTCENTSSIITMTVIANPNPTVSVTGLPTLVCSNTTGTYSISTSPTGGVITGNGVSGTSFSPSTAGVGNQVITYTMVVSSCNFPITTSINVVAAPTVVFTSSDAGNVICEGDPVTFTANTSGTANRYLFLKNSNGIQGPNSSNTFLTSSLSNGDVMSVTVDNGVATCPTTSTGITTTVGQIPNSAFSWKSTCGQNTITFHDLSSITGGSTIAKWDWDYNNDAIIDYTQLTSLPNAAYSYPAANTYQSRLRVTTDKGCYKDTVIRVYTLPGKTPTPTDPYAINFASSNQGWAYDGKNASWGWGIAPSSFGMGTRTIWSTGQNSSDGNYKIDEHSYLYGPCINFSQLDKPMIAIKLSSKITANPAGAILEATSDDGLNWVKLGNIGEGLKWYNVAGIVSTPFTYLANSTDNNPNAQGWADTVSFNNAKIPKLGLQNYAGNTSVRFRINFAAVANVTAPRFAGIGIDSVWIGNRNKMVLLEHFTTQLELKYCVPSNVYMDNIRNKRPKDVSSLYYHTNFPSADLYNQFSDADVSSRVLYYGTDVVPETHLDGNYYTGSVYSGGTSQSRIDTAKVDARSLVNARFKIDLTTAITQGHIDINTRITYTDIANSFSMKTETAVVVQTVIVEDTADGNVAINSVLRKMLPNAAGSYISINWQLNPVQQLHETWSNSIITSGRKLGVVVFVQNYDTKEVYQAAYLKGSGTLGSLVVTDVTSSIYGDNTKITVYPNPANQEAFVHFGKPSIGEYNWQMYDQLGKLVETGNVKSGEIGFSINTSKYAEGIYHIKIVDEKNSTHYTKLVIVN